MQKRYTVAKGAEFTYPADPVSLRIVQEARGVSEMSEKKRAQVKFKTVRGGEDCSDMPESSAAIFLERGLVVPFDPTAPVEQPVKDGEVK